MAETNRTGSGGAQDTGRRMTAEQDAERRKQEQEKNSVAAQQRAQGESTVSVTYSGTRRARLLRQTLMPGSEWSGGEEVLNSIDDENGADQSISPGTRLVIEEIG